MTDAASQRTATVGKGNRNALDAARPPGVKQLRCAIYTRKSTENGLEQAFNSLDNQREASEAYIKSQAHEGWRLVPGAYDDGGFSGGSLERPAVQRLLAEVRAGRVDIIVVYKVDRLTRSLSDFAKLVDLFDAHGVSFVSVTQAFNTTTSMGRLTLNVLLSFAQFEREVTGERIRDKIAASKRKGMRVGGPVPLGYEVLAKKLIPHATEAATVRLIFERYLQLGSLSALMLDLDQRGVVTKVSPKRDGSIRGGIAFTKGPLAFLLRNRAYVGEVVHKGVHYPGEQASIVPAELFEAVQASLSAKAQNTGRTVLNNASLLKGLLYDRTGNRMVPSTAKKNGARYRYYVSRGTARGSGANGRPVTRVSAPDLEAVVLKALGVDQQHVPGEHDQNAVVHSSATRDVLDGVERVILRQGCVEIRRAGHDDAPAPHPITVAWTPAKHRRHREIIGSGDQPTRPIRSETRARLVAGIASARFWLDELATGKIADTKALAVRERCSERHVRMTLNLAFLSPANMKAAVDGTLARGLGVVGLASAPMPWHRQTSPACPSSDDLRLFSAFTNGGSGSSGFDVMRPAGDAAGVSVGWSGA